MEDICEVGHAYYENLSTEEEKLANNFLKKIDLNREGEVGYREFKKFVEKQGLSSKFANRDIFDILDQDDDGTLNEEEVIPLYFASKKKNFVSCDECDALLMGAYFSCYQCFRNTSGSSYDLCCGCYGERKYKHHDDAIFYDSQTLLYKIRSQLRGSSSSLSNERKKEAERNIPNEEDKIDELQLTAEAYYENVTGDIKDEADEFFDEMDKNENEGISFSEYASYMKREGYDRRVIDRKFFKYLNQSGSGELDRMEVMTLYYVIESGRPFCDGCNEFIKGMFFTCLDCYNHKERHRPTFNVCPKCFKEGHYKHPKGYFVDNFVLLRIEGNRLGDLKKKLRTESAKESGNYNNSYYNQASRSYSTSNVMVPYQTMEETGGNDSNRYGGGSNRFSTSNDIVPYIPQPRKDKEKWLSIVSSVASMGASAAAVIGGCTVM